jgi:1,2-phenylacetyl-CoA epoxidase catalytic subunit
MILAPGTPREIWMTAADCPPDVRELLIKILSVQLCSDCSALLMGRWILEAPPDEQLEEAQAVAQEFRHAGEARQMLIDLGYDPDPLIREAQSALDVRARKLDAFMTPITSWVDMNVYKFLGEWGGMLQNVAGMGSRYLPYALWCARTFQDEGFIHLEAGRKHMEEMAADPGKLPELRISVDKWYPLFIDMFGARDSPNDLRCLERGIKTLSNHELRLSWLEGVLPALLEHDIAPADPLQGKRSRYPELADTVAEIQANVAEKQLV